MVGKIENFKHCIEEAFQNCFFIIPDYQREYVWKEKEVNKLLQDIADEFEGGRDCEYFIGTILVSRQHGQHYDVIDGQQRLTTIFLFLSALKVLLNEDSTFKNLIQQKQTNTDGFSTVHYRLTPRYEGAEDLINSMLKAKSYEEIRPQLEADGIKLYGTLGNLVDAYENVILFFNQYFSDKNQQLDTGRLRSFWGYLANSVVFIKIDTDVNSALKIFETINERGVGLNPMDLLKNLLFTQVKPDDFNRLKIEWKKITKLLEKKKEKPLRFLRYFLMANYRIKGMGPKKEAVIREDQIYEWLTLDSNAKDCGYRSDPFKFVRSLQENAEHYLNFINGKDKHGKDSVCLDNLRGLCGGGFSLHYIVLLAGCRLPDDLFDYLVSQMETFLFYFILTKTSTKELERDFSIWADELRTIADATNHKSQKTQLKEFIDKRLNHGITKKLNEFEDYFRRFTLFSLQRYRVRYILEKLTQYVDLAFQGSKTIDSLSNYSKLEIEHILPNTPEPTFRSTIESKNPDVKYDEMKNRLGNLTLLEKPINIVAGRDFYKNKRLEYEKCGNYLTRSISRKTTVGKNSSINRINKNLLEFSDWEFKEIEERQEMLLVLAKEIWTIKVLET